MARRSSTSAEAYRHALACVRAGRVDVVREAAALTAYASGRYEEALREVRAVRRMRGDDSLRAVEADCERGLSRRDRAVSIIDKTSTEGMDLAEQVELVLVSSGARADLGQAEVGLLIVDDALAALPADTDPFLLGRLAVKADRLRRLGREAEARRRSRPRSPRSTRIPRSSTSPSSPTPTSTISARRCAALETPLVEVFDAALLDLDGTAWNGDQPLEHGAGNSRARRRDEDRAPHEQCDAHSRAGRRQAQRHGLRRRSGDGDDLGDGRHRPHEGADRRGREGLRHRRRRTPRSPRERETYVLVLASADDEPEAVVQGLDVTVDWALLSEGAFAIERGARFFATNLDATLPQERGFALGNGSLVRAIQHATRAKVTAADEADPGST